jgi:integrase
VTATKGGRVRHVPMTGKLTEALRQSRSLKGRRVVCDRKGTSLSQKEVQVVMRRVGRKANVKPGVHILRHTSCSRLAMRGAPARASLLRSDQTHGAARRLQRLVSRL